MTVNDPFSDPAPITSQFASADSFRNRLVLIEPTRLELDVPNPSNPGQVADRMTATVTTLDGKGRVEIYSYKAPTGKYLEGPVHQGVWFSQERIVKAVLPNRVVTPGIRVLGRLETYKPGRPAGPGNPWGLLRATDEEKAQAAQFLANLTVTTASAPEDVDPFAPGQKAPF